ncbi:hypothetical protein L1987_42002 [Smallanthus sonchifolius]|uniref:Uncharacterized protein n=1 Tax=Smallanthus sonchifolius TaxID=185202 RepID=A0ACB9GV49_9ASTR|nr:hypothetical protein L1987_42002 [Smallanthus sonchifolius]
MERMTTRLYQGVNGYWRRRRYERLGGKSRGGSGLKWRKRFWRIRIVRKLKLKLSYSPKKLLTGIRDGYVNMMMRMANSPVVAGTGGYGEAKFGMKPREYVYDEKVIMEIYKTLVMRQAQLVPIDAPPVAVSR